jgi:hypothetical protein
VRTRLLASTVAVLLASTLAGCGEETRLTRDPGSVPSSRARSTMSGTTPGTTPSTPAQASVATPATTSSTPSVTPSEARPADIGRAFRAFARGGDLPTIGDRVDLYLGNAFTGVVSTRQAEDRRAWATCTETGSYAGATCPLSPLDVLRKHARVAYAAKPRGECLASYGPLPPDLRRLERTTIVPAAGSIGTCLENFAVQLLTDDEGRLVAVSTLLGEP